MKTGGKRFLAVDQGNSFFKLTLFEGERLLDVCRIPSGSFDDVFEVIERWNPQCGSFCSVGRSEPRMLESLRIALDGNLMIMSRSARLPVRIEYSTPESLGLDRIVLASGAASVFRGENIMVVDAGTAVTLDMIIGRYSSGGGCHSSSAFVGGRISPGLFMRLKSLHQFTSALPLVNAEGPTPLVGDSTDTAIRSGVILGLADEIVESFSQYQKKFGCDRMLLTGGDAGVLYNRICSRIPVDHVPDLMARGLLYIYNHNENK